MGNEMYGLEDKLLAILLSMLIVLPAFIVRIISGTFYIPAAIFSLAWFFYTILPLLLLFNVPINPASILYIAVTAFVFTLTALPFNWQNARRLNSNKKNQKLDSFDSAFLSYILYLSVIFSLILSLLTLFLNGWSLQQIIFDLLSTSGQFAAQRATDGVEHGVLGILSILFTYLAPVLGGLRSLSAKPWYYFIISMIPAIFTMVIQSSKLVFLVGLCFYLSSMIVARIFSNQLGLPRLNNIYKLLALVAILFWLLLISFISRFGDFDRSENIMEPLLFSLKSYSLGQVYAFSDFFSFTIGSPSASVYKDDYGSFGAYTFNSLFSMVGAGKEFPPGMYEESGWYGDIFETNIFTFFRGLIYDFGIYGSLIFLFLFGLGVHGLTYYFMRNTYTWLACSVYIGIIVFILMGYLFSVFVARYVLLNIIVVWLILTFNSHFRINGQHSRQ